MITIYWAGDSNVARNGRETEPQTGIGQAFERYIDAERVRIENHAGNGHSTRSFIAAGCLDALRERMRPGDFLFIQFGHNDEKKEDPARYSDPEIDFPENLALFVRAAREKSALPVLITPVTRLHRNAPEAKYRHDERAEGCRRTAKELGTVLVDLTKMSEALVDETEEPAREALYLYLPAGVFPAYPGANGTERT